MCNRYRAINGSASGHCCFVASVVDTQTPEIGADGNPIVVDGTPRFATVCECFEKEDAQRIADILNAAERAKPP